jgi:tetratricopeptide (TPR) repeat protein
VEAAADASIAAGEFAEAAAILQEFATRVPGQIATLLRLVEVSVDGGLEAAMYEAQAQLADAYLDAQRPDEARVIAEDLVAREPWDATHTDRLRRALQMLNVPDVDAAIAACVQASAPDPADSLDDLPAAPPSESMPRAQASVPQAATAPPPAPLMAEIDLTALLSELEGPASVPEPPARGPRPMRDLEDVFAGLRAEAGRVEDTDDSGEHMAIARSYMEMGTPEEAVSSLEIAARSPRYRFAAASALAHIYRDQSDLRRAIDWFERAAEAPAPTPEEGYALLYDLGDVLDSMGETARALAVFLELAADAPGFRDVGARVTHLSNAGTEG